MDNDFSHGPNDGDAIPSLLPSGALSRTEMSPQTLTWSGMKLCVDISATGG